ncbi:MAG: carboxypeptidase-like regulatory domain-containing protein [Planctomycetes bacterium]|nr:carboxypeptidase-like regulatory domain-containing protein [Planctomycetota bacterium]
MFTLARVFQTLLATFVLGLSAAPAAYPVPTQPDLVKVTKGRVALGIPKDWKETPIPGVTDLLGLWSIDGKGLFSTTAFIMIGRAAQKDIDLDPQRYTIREDKEVSVGGQAARRLMVEFKGEAGIGGAPAIAKGKAIGVIIKKPEADGKQLVIICVAVPEQWEKLAPLFEKVIASITIDGVGNAGATGPFVTAVYLDRGVEKPLEGATVLVGRRLHLQAFASVPSGEYWEDVLSRAPPGPRSGSIDLLCGEALFLTGTTGGNGVFSPNLPPGTYDIVVWKAGHIPQMNARVTIPGGGFKAYVTPDNQVGSTDRHRTLDTSRVFRMDPPNPGKPVVWGRVTLSTRASPSSTPPSPAAGEDVTIVVGENLSFIRKEDPRSPGTFTDVVQGDVIYAEVKTNRDGTYAIPMPLGSYSMIVWKQGHIPEERISLHVWPGDYFCKLIKDDQPGSSGRHQALDTTSQNIPRKKLDGRPGIRGMVKLSDRGVRTPGEGVTILIGQELRLDHPIIPDPTDKVTGKLLIARTVTNKEGEFFAAVPAGAYQLIVWKAGYIPQEFNTVTVPPGVHNVTLIRDNQPGSSGRHANIDTSKVPVPPPPAAPAPEIETLFPLLPLLFRAAPPELTQRAVGAVTLSVPADWRKDPDTPTDEGAWLTGKADRPDASFSVMRDVSFDGLVEQLTDPKREQVKIGGRTAMSQTGLLRTEAEMMARVVVLTQPEKDGRRIAFFAKAPQSAWPQHTTTFDAILASVKIPAATTPVVPLPNEELKELARVSRVPIFKAEFEYTAYEDRVTIKDAAGVTAVLGVAGRGKKVGTAFRPFLDKEKAVAGLLGEAVSLELRSLSGALLVQIFEGGTLVQEKATGLTWWNLHTKRPRDLRPLDETTRYPRVVFGGTQYAVAAYPDRVQIWDIAAKKEMIVKVGTAGQAIPEAFRKVIEKDKLEAAFGRALSGEASLFDTAGRIQVYEGGAMFVQPGTDRFWWCSHPKRVVTVGGDVRPPEKPVLALPKDPNAVVIRLDYVGGYTPPRKTANPYLEILADGRVTLTDPFGSKPTVRAKLTPANVLDFVAFAVNENHFFEMNSTAIERAIQVEVKKKKLPTVTDLQTLVITVRSADGVHEVRCYAPQFYAEQLPDLKPLQQLQAIHHRLTKYMDALRGEE